MSDKCHLMFWCYSVHPWVVILWSVQKAFNWPAPSSQISNLSQSRINLVPVWVFGDESDDMMVGCHWICDSLDWLNHCTKAVAASINIPWMDGLRVRYWFLFQSRRKVKCCDRRRGNSVKCLIKKTHKCTFRCVFYFVVAKISLNWINVVSFLNDSLLFGGAIHPSIGPIIHNAIWVIERVRDKFISNNSGLLLNWDSRAPFHLCRRLWSLSGAASW